MLGFLEIYHLQMRARAAGREFGVLKICYLFVRNGARPQSEKKLRELLQFDDDTMTNINSTYTPPKESLKRSGRYFVKFLEVLFSS